MTTDMPGSQPFSTFPEPARDLPLDAGADVIVCGGGPAGGCLPQDAPWDEVAAVLRGPGRG